MKRTSIRLAAMALLGLVASACSCGGAVSTTLAPTFVLEGESVITDPKGEAHYAIDFGTVTVGSRFTPEVFVANQGNANLSVKAENVDAIPAPFSLASGAFDLRPGTRRPIEFTIAP